MGQERVEMGAQAGAVPQTVGRVEMVQAQSSELGPGIFGW